MRGSSDSDGTIGSAGSSVRRRFLSPSSPSPNAFLTPAFTAAASAGGSISNSPLNIDPSLLRFTQSRLSRLHFSSSSSSSSSNEPSDSSSPSAAAAAARMRLQQLLSLRSTQSPLSPIENLQSVPLSERSYPIYKTPVKVGMEEEVLVFDAMGDCLPTKHLNSSSSPSSVNNNTIGANFFFKTDICRSWEECGFCRFGSRCQFAHGKEELRGSPRPSKLKPESGKQGSAVGSSVYGDKYLRSEAFDSASAASEVICKIDRKKMKIICPERVPRKAEPEPSRAEPEPSRAGQQQEPSFSWPPTDAEEAKIQRVLYGPSRSGRRLPAFVEICSDSE